MPLALPASSSRVPRVVVNAFSASSVNREPTESKVNLVKSSLKRDLNMLADSCISALKTWEEEKDPRIIDDLRQYCMQMAGMVDQTILSKQTEVRQGSKLADALIKRVHALRQPLRVFPRYPAAYAAQGIEQRFIETAFIFYERIKNISSALSLFQEPGHA